jgi:hypothetical protein
VSKGETMLVILLPLSRDERTSLSEELFVFVLFEYFVKDFFIELLYDLCYTRT